MRGLPAIRLYPLFVGPQRLFALRHVHTFIPNFMQIRSMQDRVTKNRAAEICVRKVCVRQFAAIEPDFRAARFLPDALKCIGIGKHGLLAIRLVEYRLAQRSARKVCATEVSGRENGVVGARACQSGAFQDRALKTTLRKLRLAQIGPSEIGAGELATAKVEALQGHFDQLRFNQDCRVESRLIKNHAAQIVLHQYRELKKCVREIHRIQAAPDKRRSQDVGTRVATSPQPALGKRGEF